MLIAIFSLCCISNVKKENQFWNFKKGNGKNYANDTYLPFCCKILI